MEAEIRTVSGGRNGNYERKKTEMRKLISESAKDVLGRNVEILDDPGAREGRPVVKSKFEAVVEKLLRDPSASVRLATLELLLNYGYGKPVQQIEQKIEQTRFVAEVPPVQTTEAWMEKWAGTVHVIDDDDEKPT